MKPPSVSELMMKVEMIVPKLQGWCTESKAQHLAALVIALRPKATVEIGVFGGRSLIPLAMAHQFIGEGFALGIDPWAKAASLDGMDGANKEWWDKLDHEAIYAGFMSASARLRADGFMQVMRCTSDIASTVTVDSARRVISSAEDMLVVPDVIDLLHIDGNHGPQAVKDVDNYASRVRSGGILIMDDIDWATDATARVTHYKFNFLYKLETGAVFQRN